MKLNQLNSVVQGLMKKNMFMKWMVFTLLFACSISLFSQDNVDIRLKPVISVQEISDNLAGEIIIAGFINDDKSCYPIAFQLKKVNKTKEIISEGIFEKDVFKEKYTDKSLKRIAITEEGDYLLIMKDAKGNRFDRTITINKK